MMGIVPTESINERLLRARRELFGERGQARMARALGITPQRYGPYEEDRSIPDEVLRALATSTPVDVRWLLTGQGDMVSRTEAEGALRVAETSARYGVRDAESKSALLRRIADDLEQSEKAQETVADGKRIIRLPIIAGAIAAGAGRVVEDGKVRDWAHCLRAHIPNPKDTDCIDVRGDSMDPDIPDGSLVGIDHSQRDPRQIAAGHDPFAAVRDDEGGCLIRRVKMLDGKVRFQPSNPAPDHPAWDWEPSSEAESPIIGKVVFIYRACR